MDFKPGLPEGNVNVSHNSPAKEFLLLFCGITVILLTAYLILGLFVDIAVSHISPELEDKIFKTLSFSENITPAHSEKLQRLQALVNDLQQCTTLPYQLQVDLVDAETPNAFAFPGGKIVVFSPLLDTVQSENGLAFVLAHELSHFKNRDHLRGMGRSIVFTALVSAVTGPGSDLTRMVTPVTHFSQAQYSQQRETLADEQALAILACHYGHVGGATEFFQAMAGRIKRKGTYDSVSHYFSSHPEAENRVANLVLLAERNHMIQGPVIPLEKSLLQ